MTECLRLVMGIITTSNELWRHYIYHVTLHARCSAAVMRRQLKCRVGLTNPITVYQWSNMFSMRGGPPLKLFAGGLVFDSNDHRRPHSPPHSYHYSKWVLSEFMIVRNLNICAQMNFGNQEKKLISAMIRWPALCGPLSEGWIGVWEEDRHATGRSGSNAQAMLPTPRVFSECASLIFEMLK